jgi:biopolymer transport protein TolQ
VDHQQNSSDMLSLILAASPVVQLVMLALALISLWSWVLIFRKKVQLKKMIDEADGFEDEFWSGADLVQLYQRAERNEEYLLGMESIFHAGFREFLRDRQNNSLDSDFVIAGAQRSMRAAMMREMDYLEQNMQFLAMAGSTSPYIGLFGTVWGIMNSFRSFAGLKQVTLAQVAPGIAEALIATALGLVAAIPAVVAYNRYSGAVERLAIRYESFSEEFINILSRQVQKERTNKQRPAAQPNRPAPQSSARGYQSPTQPTRPAPQPERATGAGPEFKPNLGPIGRSH